MTDTALIVPTLAAALEKKGFDSLTPVQEAVTRAELRDADLLVSAQTGSGKTVGFGLAIAPTILEPDGRFPPASSPLALVIAPTRELALQVKRELAWLYDQAGATVASCVGGMDMRDERRALDRGAHIVVATPGRLRDHIQRGSIDLSMIRAVVLDEADEMLDLGFREDLEFILGQSPESRRTLMFSATVPKSIATLAQNYQKNAIRVSTAGERTQHADIAYRALNVAAVDAENAIVNVLRYYEAPNAIIFCNTRATVNRLATRLSNRAFSVVALSGELSQTERTHALQAMRDGRARVCVATDVAARGIDLPNLELVIHADLPTNADTLLHRSGRTGRAGRKGVSALIVSRNARRKAETLLGIAKVTAEWSDAPSAEAVSRRDDERLLSDPIWSEPASPSDRALAADLLQRHSAAQIAAAYIRLYRGNRSAPEELAAPSSDTGQRTPFGPSVWFALAIGRSVGAEPRRVLPMLCRSGNITRDDVGAIRIQETETFVEVLAASEPQLLSAIGPGGMLEGGVRIRRLDAPPFGERTVAVDRPAATERTAEVRRPAPRPGTGDERKVAPARSPEAPPVQPPRDAPPAAAGPIGTPSQSPAAPSPPPAREPKARPERMVPDTPARHRPAREGAPPASAPAIRKPRPAEAVGGESPASTAPANTAPAAAKAAKKPRWGKAEKAAAKGGRAGRKLAPPAKVEAAKGTAFKGKGGPAKGAPAKGGNAKPHRNGVSKAPSRPRP